MKPTPESLSGPIVPIAVKRPSSGLGRLASRARSTTKASGANRLNRLRSTIRARVEHVFGFQHNSMGGKLIRTIGLARAKTKIALMNLTYNIMRYLQLERRTRLA